jgi:hypothetical protein
MKRFFLYIIVLLLFSCKNQHEQLRERIEPIIRAIVLQDSLISKIDSIHIYRIDTLFNLQYAKRRIINLNNAIDLYVSMSKSYFTSARLERQQAALHTDQARLYLTVLNSKALGKMELNDSKASLDSSASLSNQGNLYLDTAKSISSKINLIRDSIKAKKIASNNFLGYQVIFKILGSDKRNIEVKKDSLYTFLSPNFRIIPINKIK